tara:strand:- start:12018 stop:12713 length:696 start_codon:yes stop_codon:yes gene_type:complete
MSQTILITGANRGLGLEFTRQYLEYQNQVIACCRDLNKALALHDLKEKYPHTLTLIQLDVTDTDAVHKLAQDLEHTELDLLINNAGVYGPKHKPLGALCAEDFEEVLKVNTIAPLILSQAFIPHLAQTQGKVAFITSRMGSITDNQSGGSYLYRASKAALNALGKSLALDLEADDIKVLIIHPGWVKTDMGGEHAWITPEQSISQMRKLIHSITLDQSGQFWHCDGSKLPW